MLKWFGTKTGMRTLIIILAVALVVSIVGQIVGWPNIGGLLTGAATRGDREDPLVAFKFGLEIEKKQVGFFTSASGIGSETEVNWEKTEDKTTGATTIQALPGRLTWTPITLKRGVTSDTNIWDWRQQVIENGTDDARSDCSIVAYNQSNQAIARWELVNAWPASVVGPVMEDGNTNYMVEEIIIVHEGVERVE